MSKKKKTMNVLLEEALLSNEEKLYDLPDNWIWVNLYSISDLIADGSHNPPPKQEKGIPMLSGKNIQNGYMTFDTNRYITEEQYKREFKRTPLEPGDLLLTIVGSIGRTTILKEAAPLFALQRSVAHIKAKHINSSFLKYYFQSLPFQNFLLDNAKGTAQKGIYLKTLKSSPIALPNKLEQARIAEKIERLLNKIEEAKKLIEEAKGTFELRRAAILDKAFRGELTKNWRAENNKSNFQDYKENDIEIGYHIPNQWHWTTFGEVTTFVSSGSTPKGGSKVYQETGVPFIRSQNVLKNHMSVDNIVYISDEIHSNMKRTHLDGSETLFNITGASIGRAAKMNKELIPANVNQHVCALRFNDDVNDYLPQYWLNSPYMQREINKKQIGVTRQALNYTQVKNLPFPLIPKEEQKELLRVVENLLNKENELHVIESLFNDLERLKDSILLKAFRGELGTNDPKEESAIELLKEVLQEHVK
ncbi:restriction endonuclease subunit S [Alkalihalobacillus hwajinpoensis]|uniref:restriction endonuclease subunit S n=1 Tax=Guptibacillus hwajinpoensis TaxID=208199 RepID=UPI001884121C|nr:restriction endonuclease subunit S [Pseudalkalibacillus hwajinpoensis]MBF0706030.1 restriction endonuclease subunit S [Pseudalkalibacillus hwajinpoensis]